MPPDFHVREWLGKAAVTAMEITLKLAGQVDRAATEVYHVKSGAKVRGISIKDRRDCVSWGDAHMCGEYRKHWNDNSKILQLQHHWSPKVDVHDRSHTQKTAHTNQS